MHNRTNLTILCFSSLAMVAGLQVRPASACSLPRDGIHNRTTYPPSGATLVPTNARIVIDYGWRNGRADPALQPGLGAGIRKPGGTPLTVSVVTKRAPGDWREVKKLVIQPQAQLEPNTTYEVFDQHPQVPCYSFDPTPCNADQVTTFATFTTGAGPDTTSPQFEGLRAVTPQGMPYACDNGACCGPYVQQGLSLNWNAGSDDGVGATLAYNVYRDGELFIPVVLGLSLEAVQFCSGGSLQGPVLPPGAYTVKAVDWAGNEDTNSRVHNLANLCVPVVSATDAGTDSGIDGSLPNPDATEVVDGSAPRFDGSANDAAPADGGDVGSPPGDGCGCRVGGNASGGSAVALAFLASFFLLRKRRARHLRFPHQRLSVGRPSGAIPHSSPWRHSTPRP